ncbi:MAG: alpha/beta fold hydrolase [Thermohalobaculum sp.]|nr:alpha/beta fold hydrolase [Thermohalobaculum sp.]
MITSQDAAGGSWLVAWPSRLTPVVDLLCFAGAGAGASVFRPWAQGLPAFAALIACQLPGRENRIDEPAAASLADAAGRVGAAYLALRPQPRPVVLFGHSMGGSLAFQVARGLDQAGRAPAAIVISASAPPTGTGQAQPPGHDELRRLLLAYDPANQAIAADPELFMSLAPTLGADIALLRTHAITPPDIALAVPACLLAGAEDRLVPAAAVARWMAHLRGPVTQEVLPGGHHFPFTTSRQAVLARLGTLLRQAGGRGAGR